MVPRVLGTVELLENILLGLDIRTLLLSQRTNRHFKSVIDRSTKLQQALYFKLDASTEQPCSHEAAWYDLNPLLVSMQDNGSGISRTTTHRVLQYVDLVATKSETGEELYNLGPPDLSSCAPSSPRLFPSIHHQSETL